jgi:hypothetical protein
MKEKVWEIFQTLPNNNTTSLLKAPLWSLKNKSRQLRDWQRWDSLKLSQLRLIWLVTRMKIWQLTYCSTDWQTEISRWNFQRSQDKVTISKAAAVTKEEVATKEEATKVIQVIRRRMMMTTFSIEKKEG